MAEESEPPVDKTAAATCNVPKKLSMMHVDHQDVPTFLTGNTQQRSYDCCKNHSVNMLLTIVETHHCM